MTPHHTDTGRWDGVSEVARMAVPIVIGAVSFTFMQFIDVWFVSHLGVNELAAVGGAGIWVHTFAMLVVGCLGCVSTFVSQSLGRNQPENCARYAWQGIYISLLTLVVSAVMWPLSGTILSVFPQTPEVVALETTFFRIRMLGLIFVAIEMTFSAFFQAINRPAIAMAAAIMANVVNIVLDYLLIFGNFGFPMMGVAGAATATVIALFVQAAILLAVFLSRPMNAAYSTRSSWAFDFTKAADLFRVGWPSGMASLLDILSWSIFITFIVGRLGTTSLAAQTAALQFMHLVFIPAMGINMAITPIVGQWLGRGNVEIATARTYTAIKMAMGYMIPMALIMAIFGYPLMSLFSEDEAVRDIGRVLLICSAVFSGFDAISIVVYGALRGAGDTRFMMILMLVGSYCVSLPLGWLFSGPLGMGAKGAWFGATIYIILLSGAFFWRLRSGEWRKIAIFSEDQIPDAPATKPLIIEPRDAAIR